MAARKARIKLDDRWKEKIKCGEIIDRLIKHINGTVELSTTQINAAKILLSKVVPDLKAMEHSGEVTHSYAMRLPDQAQSVEQWQQKHSQVTLQ